MIEVALYDYLTANLPGVATYFMDADNDASMPFVVFEITGADREQAIDSGYITFSDVEFNCYASSPASAIQTEESLVALLNDYRGDMGGYNITLIRFRNHFDGQEEQSMSFFRTVTMALNYTD